MSPSSGEQREEKRHGQVHDPVGGGADYTSGAAVSLEGPVLGVVFLEYTVAHCKACQSVSRDAIQAETCITWMDVPQMGSWRIPEPIRTSSLALFDSSTSRSSSTCAPDDGRRYSSVSAIVIVRTVIWEENVLAEKKRREEKHLVHCNVNCGVAI